MILRWDAPDAATLRRMLADPPRPSLAPGRLRTTHFRDVYFDTSAGELRQRGARCRLRFTAGGERRLTLWQPAARRIDERVRNVDDMAALAGTSEAALRLRALIDPARLAPWIERQVERACRTFRIPVALLPVCDVVTDQIALNRSEITATLCEVSVRARRWGHSAAGRIARALEAAFALRPAGSDALHRAITALDAAEAEGIGRELRGEREVALVAVEHGRVGLCRAGAELRLPVYRGSGEDACRAALRQLVGSGEGQLRLLGVVPRSGDRVPLEVWTARRLHRHSGNGETLQWFAPADLVARVGSPLLRDPGTLAALTVAARSPLVPEWSGASFGHTTSDDASLDADAIARASRVTLSELRVAAPREEAKDPARASPEQFLNPELSWLEFNARVLELAEDERTPLAARLRFLSIFSTNLDQFLMTQIGALQQLVAAGRNVPSADGGGLTHQETLDAFGVRLRPLLARQYQTFRSLAGGLSLARWDELGEGERAALRTRCADEILPFVSPKALTRAPGHPFPLIGDRRLALLVALRDRAGAPVHYTIVELPQDAPRFVARANGRGWLATEDLVRANLDLLYPGRIVAGAHAFRLTRSGDLQLDETTTANFLQAIEEELVRRRSRPVLRIEFEASTPPTLQDLLQRELRFEESEGESTLTAADVFVSDGMVDLGGLSDVAAGSLPDYPPLVARAPFDAQRPVAEQIDEHDVLVYHPHDSFPDSFERFIGEAAEDPEVQAIKLTLYRPGGPSAIGDALRRAAIAGKDVSVLVELKARFDEARNISWARSLEREGIHVVTGLVSLKTHAKMALVVRQLPSGRVHRYAHVGSGNYNANTARVYTDFGLFTADPRITADVHSLFNELTGSSHAPQVHLRHLLAAPIDLLDRVLAMIDRETAHARAGRSARIRAKLNALSDSTIIQALYRASQAGVDVDLVVRGICTLRPGVPGLSERIRVVSILGRFLEHGRIYHFANAGEDEYYIGSADWRPRNLRRRIEVMAPVFEPAARHRLDEVLTGELTTTEAWALRPDGGYDHL
ncbi:MAG: polyphosphate kinase 1 [Gemmatimonadetes bacterium]|nr:MAG: polyphosphate kinase 1 [Gemmatimonadetes bacterium 13_1_40CM_3_66_12]OLD90081.1 MAG: polyphosphate kinase 1 [Gemmatimonadetes bacterium 13_1_20CM_4_66_11]PYP98457.1 MAG: polyphosphate kinase 1 [Gemmatimonadota bacterium]